MLSEQEQKEQKVPAEKPATPNGVDSASVTSNASQTLSPAWGQNTKLVIGLALVAFIAFLFFRFLNIVGPLVLAFVLSYLFFPMAEGMNRYLRLPWRIAVTLLYLVLLVLLIGSIAMGGLALVEQLQSLIHFLNTSLTNLPQTIQNLVTQPFQIGPFVFQPAALDIDVNTVVNQVLGAVQPILSGAGTLLGTFASRAAEVIGWTFFILLISYFMLAESRGFPNLLVNMRLPGYAQDLQRLSDELSRIWNAFLRGQVTIVLLTILFYTFWLGMLGVKFFFGLALLAGLARFIPYVGPAIAWTTYGLVAFFQGTTIFGMPPMGYAALVVGSAWLFDLMIDNLVSPRIMAATLRVHPATVMISALIGANLLGVIGVVLAAPVLATVQLFFDYIFNKLLDQDPWAHLRTNPKPEPLTSYVPEIQTRYQVLLSRMARLRFPWQK